MRSHAKASTAGSTQRQARGLGRMFRGVLAIRGASSHAKGSGASPHARRHLAVFAALALAALVILTTSAAFGAATTEYVKSFGPDGTESSDFERINGVAVDQQTGDVYVLDGEAGTLEKFEADGTPLDWGGSAPYIAGKEISGLAPYTARDRAEVAVDSTTHVVYVTEQHSIRAFHEDGEAAEFTAGPGAGTSEIPSTGEIVGVTVDVNGDIYASELAGSVAVYASTGEAITSFTNAEGGNLAVASDGALYVADSSFTSHSGVREFVPDEFPVVATTTYSAGNTLTPEGFTLAVGVDPVTGDIYALKRSTEHSYIEKYDSSGHFVRYFGKSGEGDEPDEEGVLANLAQGVAVVGGGEEFQFYVGNTRGLSGSEDFSKVEIFGEVINPGAPSIESTSAIDVTSSSATLRALINPNTFATTYHFEYGLGDCSLSACTSVPLTPASIGSGHRGVTVLQGISGLQIGTTYHYRVIAENSEETTVGPERSFTTQLGGLGFQLADDRAWEMVSPPNKHGGGLLLPSQGVTQAAADGSGVAYQSAGSIEADPYGNRALDNATILSRRSAAGGWSSEDVTSPHTEVTPLRFGGEFKVFSTNLERAAFEEQDSTLLSPEASERTPYLRENTMPPVYRPLVTGKEGFANVPPGTVFGGNGGGLGRDLIVVQGANPSLSHVVINSKTPLVSGAADFSLYEWASGGLHPVSELPAGEGGAVVSGEVGSGQSSIRNAVSEDGLRVFWSKGHYDSAVGPNYKGLYLRNTEAEETVRLDVPQLGASESGEVNPSFQGASADGTVVFFTDSQQLTADASSSGRDLYRCVITPEAAASGCTTLSDISAPPEGSGEAAGVKEMAPAFGQDGNSIYFFATGALDSTANPAGETASPGSPNLYVWRKGHLPRFIASLPSRDASNWGHKATDANSGVASKLSASSSPDGRYLTFMSERGLTGYDNRDSVAGELDEEVFRYDALNDRLVCVSCNPSGASPDGQELDPSGGNPTWADPQTLWSKRWVAAVLPDAHESEPTVGYTLSGSRAVHDNGRVFFNAIDSLVPADSNGQWDVYQWEPTGTGDCTASSGGAAIARSGGGCVSLVSSGTAEGEAAFLDASEGGDDVFFLTTAQLNETDEDHEADVYDARVDGIPATLPKIAECLGEACQPAARVPNDATPASAVFKGQGNPKPNVRKRCAKGKRAVRRKGRTRCVRRRAKHRHHRRAHHNRRTHR